MRRFAGEGFRFSCLVGLALVLPSLAAAVVAGQVDDFQDGSLQGWTGGSSLTNQANGGPAGAGDRYLEIDSNGGFLGSFNVTQWSGDYDAANVLALSADLANFGPDAVSLRIMILTPGCQFGGSACTAWTTTVPVSLGAGSGWATTLFPLEEADMTRVIGSDSFTATLQNVERVLIRHQTGAPAPPGVGQTVDAVLGVDNVSALPEPASVAALGAGTLLLVALRRRRQPPSRAAPGSAGCGAAGPRCRARTRAP